MYTFKATIAPEDREELEQHCDEDPSSGWRFRLTFCAQPSQAYCYNALHSYYVRKLLVPETLLTYDGRNIFTYEGRLGQIPRPYFARALLDAFIQEIPGRVWHIQIWNTKEREWHKFECDYTTAHGYDLVWTTTAKNFQFNHVEITDTLWLHAVLFGDEKRVGLLRHYQPEQEVKNGDHIFNGRTVTVSSGHTLYDLTLHTGATLTVLSGGSVIRPYIEDGALMNLCYGAVASAGSVSGIMHVYGSAVNVAIHGSAEVHSKGSADSCTVLSGGRIDIKDQGWVYNGQIRSGASAIVSSGGNMQTVDIKANGVAVCMSGASATALIISSGGHAYINNDARVEVIKCAGGII